MRLPEVFLVSPVAIAVDIAARAFPGWRRVPAPRRAEILYQFADRLRENHTELAGLITAEMGKQPVEARGEVQEAIDMAEYMAGEGRRSFGQTVPSELPDKFAMSIRDPVGVVAMITPWNFPVAVPSWKFLPALVLGNTVVWKPSPRTPRCAARVVDWLGAAGLPAGVLNLVEGDAAVGAELVRAPQVRVVTFTGSNAVGRQVAVAAAEAGKRCALELGGKNAVIVLADADLDLAVEGIVWSAFGTSGQRCTACSRLIVQRSVWPRLRERLVPAVRGIELGPLIDTAAVERCERYVREAVAGGARVIVGGEEQGRQFAATILENVNPRMAVAQEEMFGPVLSVLEVNDLAEAVRVNNDVAYGLVSAIYTRDVNSAFTAARELTTGLVYVNAGTTGSEVHLPFGGTRGTSNGAREAGTAALDTFSEWKTVYVDYSGRLQRAQIDTRAAEG